MLSIQTFTEVLTDNSITRVVKFDVGRKNLAITYNLLNLQQTLSQNGTTVASYLWLTDGTKCGVIDNNNNGYDYMGSLIYSRSGSSRTLESATFGGGRFVITNNTVLPYYYITDHLGSTRVITDNSGNVQERDDYYPFGGRHANPSYAQTTANRQKFNGKELQTTGNTGFLDYGARMYDDVIGRWSVVDPMAEKYTNMSPYAYCANSLIIFVDPDGKDIRLYNVTQNNNRGYPVAQPDLSAKTEAAMRDFVKTTGGRAFLAQFAKAGDIVGGYKFTKDGSLSNNTLNIWDYSYSNENENVTTHLVLEVMEFLWIKMGKRPLQKIRIIKH